MEKLTEKEIDIIGHSLGINVYHAVRSKKKKDKKLPKEFYRNYFCSSALELDEDYKCLLGLEKRGICFSGERIGNLYFHVTEKGIELFKTEFNNYVNQQPTVG